MNAKQAINMIQDHGHKAFATPDGLLALSTALANDEPCSRDYMDDARAFGFCANAVHAISFASDIVFEESTVFEVRDDGTVDSLAIRRWLGY